MLISNSNSLETRMLRTNIGILAKINSIFYKEKLVSYANVFYLVNAEIVRRKDFALMFLALHQEACLILSFL